MKLLLALTCTATLALPLQAQTVQRQAQVYRCGPEGRDLRDAPCPSSAASGASTVSYDEPSTADRRATREQHLADARQAAALAAARRASDAEARQQRALHLGPPPAPPAAPASAATPHRAKPPRLARPHPPARPRAAASGSAQASR